MPAEVLVFYIFLENLLLGQNIQVQNQAGQFWNGKIDNPVIFYAFPKVPEL